MVEDKSKKTKRAERGTKDGMDKEPIEEGVFDLPLISDPLLLCVFGFLGLYSFGSARKELDLIKGLKTQKHIPAVDLKSKTNQRNLLLLAPRPFHHWFLSWLALFSSNRLPPFPLISQYSILGFNSNQSLRV